MKPHVSDAIWLNESAACSIEELAEVSGLSMEELRELVDTGVIAPVDQKAKPAAFHLHYIVTANTARRLRDDFELDARGVAIALVLLRRIHFLEAELQSK
jgi:chaperone modulatory protein CbpM